MLICKISGLNKYLLMFRGTDPLDELVMALFTDTVNGTVHE